MPRFRAKDAPEFIAERFDGTVDSVILVALTFGVDITVRVRGDRSVTDPEVDEVVVGAVALTPGEWLVRDADGTLFKRTPDVFTTEFDAIPAP